jgi:hypothetical protein
MGIRKIDCCGFYIPSWQMVGPITGLRLNPCEIVMGDLLGPSSKR